MSDQKYERFTERSCKVMNFAVQEATQLYHKQIEPEHVLLGLLKEGSGIGGTVLRQRGINLAKLRTEVQTLRPVGTSHFFDHHQNSSDTELVISFAYQEASKLNHNYIGTEDILLGLLALEDKNVIAILTAFAVEQKSLRQDVLKLLGKYPALSATTGDSKNANSLESGFVDLKNALGNPGLTDAAALQQATSILVQVNH